MTCTALNFGGGTAIVCGQTRIRTCACGVAAPRLCDWRIGGTRTCDAPLCDACTFSPREGKDLCAHHSAIWAKHPKNPARISQQVGP